jgi:hypothetical protein
MGLHHTEGMSRTDVPEGSWEKVSMRLAPKSAKPTRAGAI